MVYSSAPAEGSRTADARIAAQLESTMGTLAKSAVDAGVRVWSPRRDPAAVVDASA
jgi:hypothetical protein